MSRRFTADEAQQVLALAAERSHAAHTETLLTLGDLEEAARAAGIDPAHVRTAAADVFRPGRRSVRTTFLGLPAETRQTRILPGVLGDSEWASTVETARDAFGRRGAVDALGDTREWVTDERRAPVRLVAEPTEGGTRVTVERSSWPGVLGVAGAVASNALVGVVLFAVWLGTGATGLLWLPALVLTAFALAFAVGASVVLRKKGQREVEAFDEVLSHAARVAVPDASEPVRVGDDDLDVAETLGVGRLDGAEEPVSPRRASRSRA